MAEKERLQQEISTIQNSISEIDVNQPECPFCKSPQILRKESNISSRRPLYVFCGCDEMNQFRDKANQLPRLVEELEIVDKKLAYRKRKAEQLLGNSGIGERFLEASFENYERKCMPAAFDAAVEYADEFDHNRGTGLIFTGNVGTGKTHLAAAIASHIIKNFYVTVDFVVFTDTLSDIRNAIAKGSNETEAIENQMCSSSLLIIDDLGKEKQSQFTNELLYRVINKRYKENLPVIITTNYTLQELAERLDYAVFSRIVEMCKAVDMTGDDYRVKSYLRQA